MAAGEGLVIVAAIVFGATLPITPLQILWINMTTAVLLGLPLGILLFVTASGQLLERRGLYRVLSFVVNVLRRLQQSTQVDAIILKLPTTVQQWLAKHPRFHMHFTPTSASWLNMVERFFRDITDKRIRRDSFTSVAELELAIDLYVAHHNIDPKPFIWTKSARDILQKVIRANARLSSKQNETLH